MKQCVHCRQWKCEEDFHWSNKLLGIRQKHCCNCMRKFNRESYERRTEEYKTKIYENREKRRQNARQFVWDYLSTHSCIDCGEADPIVLEFDHIDPSNKIESVSELAKGHYSIEKIEQEISKCVVRCANCHRRKTFKENGWFTG